MDLQEALVLLAPLVLLDLLDHKEKLALLDLGGHQGIEEKLDHQDLQVNQETEV